MDQAVVSLFVVMLILGIAQSSPAPSLSSSSSSSSSLAISSIFKSRHPRSLSRLVHRRVCSKNTPCMWAYCPWSPRVLLENDDCKYINSICVCQWGQTCSPTIDVRPDNAYLTVPFVCKSS